VSLCQFNQSLLRLFFFRAWSPFIFWDFNSLLLHCSIGPSFVFGSFSLLFRCLFQKKLFQDGTFVTELREEWVLDLLWWLPKEVLSVDGRHCRRLRQILSRKETQPPLQVRPKGSEVGRLALPRLRLENGVDEFDANLDNFFDRGHFLSLLEKKKDQTHQEDAAPVFLGNQLGDYFVRQTTRQWYGRAFLCYQTGELQLLFHD